MKKILTLIIIVFAMFLISGCDLFEKKLVCTYTETDEGIKSETEITVGFKKDKAVSVKAINKSTMESEELAKEYYDDYGEMLKSSFSETGYTTTIKLSGKTITLTGEAKVDEIKDEDFKTQMAKTYDEVKKELEDEQYTCK